MENPLVSYNLSLELDMIYEEGITQDEDLLEFDNAKDDQQKKNLIDTLRLKYKDHRWAEFDTKFQKEVQNILKKDYFSLLVEDNQAAEFNNDLEAKIEFYENISKYQVQQKTVLFAKIPEDQKTSLTEQINKIKEFDKYDVQIHFDMAKLLTQGVEIKYRKDMSKDYKKAIFNKQTVQYYAVLGELKVGKSWFMTKLSGKQLRQGQTFDTEGICLIYDSTNNEKKSPIGNCCYIDTAGFGGAQQKYIRYHQLTKRLNFLQTPVTYEEPVITKPQIQEVSNEKKMIVEIQKEKVIKIEKQYESEENKSIVNEIFVQRFVLEMSTAIYLMVGQMTRDQEIFLDFIFKEIANNQRKYSSIQKIFVVHNFQELTTVKEVEDQILQDIIKCQNVQCRNFETVGNQKMGYYLQTVTKDLNAYHFITAKEGSPAGKFYNGFTFQQIRQQQQQYKPDPTKDICISIPQKLCFFINNNFLNYCKIQIKEKIQNREIVEKAYDKFEKDLDITSRNIDDKKIELKKKTCIARLNQSSSLITLNQLKLIEYSIDIHIKNIAIAKTGKQNEVAIKNMYLPEYSIHDYEQEKCFKIFVDVSCYVLYSFSGKIVQIREKLPEIKTPVLISTSFYMQGRRVPYNITEIKYNDKNFDENLIGLQFGNIAYHIPIDQYINLDYYSLNDFPHNNNINNNQPQKSNNKNIIYHSYGIVEFVLQYK